MKRINPCLDACDELCDGLSCVMATCTEPEPERDAVQTESPVDASTLQKHSDRG